jgi:hypothetical protein
MTIRSALRLCVAFASSVAAMVVAHPARAQITDQGPGPWGPTSLAYGSLVTVATDYVRAPNYDSPRHTAGLAYCDQQGLDMNACSHLGDRAEYCTYGSFARGYMIATPNPNRFQCPTPGQHGMYSVSSPDVAMCLIYLHCSDGGWYQSVWSTAPARCESRCPTGLTADEVQVITWITNTPW